MASSFVSSLSLDLGFTADFGFGCLALPVAFVRCFSILPDLSDAAEALLVSILSRDFAVCDRVEARVERGVAGAIAVRVFGSLTLHTMLRDSQLLVESSDKCFGP